MGPWRGNTLCQTASRGVVDLRRIMSRGACAPVGGCPIRLIPRFAKVIIFSSKFVNRSLIPCHCLMRIVFQTRGSLGLLFSCGRKSEVGEPAPNLRTGRVRGSEDRICSVSLLRKRVVYFSRIVFAFMRLAAYRQRHSQAMRTLMLLRGKKPRLAQWFLRVMPLA